MFETCTGAWLPNRSQSGAARSIGDHKVTSTLGCLPLLPTHHFPCCESVALNTNMSRLSVRALGVLAALVFTAAMLPSTAARPIFGTGNMSLGRNGEPAARRGLVCLLPPIPAGLPPIRCSSLSRRGSPCCPAGILAINPSNMVPVSALLLLPRLWLDRACVCVFGPVGRWVSFPCPL